VGGAPPPGACGSASAPARPTPDARPDPNAAHDKDWSDIDDGAGFHASQSVDVIVVISGRIWLELDDGVETLVSAGEVIVQNCARHRWRNHGEDWPLLAVVVIGAETARPLANGDESESLP
jgi:mannose-6-phosphate isomerase-like protein (cupin superfamily)